jgi:signal transduction histidine kinase
MVERRTGGNRRKGNETEERRLRSIIEQLADGIVIVDADGAIRFANPAAEHLFARSAHTLVGTELGFPITNGSPAEIDLVRPDGKGVTAELRVVEMEWQGEPARLVSIRDITDRRRAEERALQVERERTARAEAEAANRAKSDFLAVMSHELRTPLNAVIGYAQLLDLGIGGQLSPEHQRHIARILASSQHLLGLVSEILDLAKVDADQLTIDVAPVPALTAADAAVALVQPAAEAHGIRLVAPGAPEEGISFVGDENRVRQILVNLLTNAVKFTDSGGTVSLEYGHTTSPDHGARLHAGGSWTYFRIRDTGIGIADEQLARIFEPFVQVMSGRTRSNDGSGLGLAISRRLARLMHGDITVRSTAGAGSTFTLWLPSVAPEFHGKERRESAVPDVPHVHGLAQLGEILTRDLQTLLETFVARLRAECPAPNAAGLKFYQLSDHVASYLADLAGLLVALDEADGQPSSVLADAMEIHRVVAVRHGAQRARLSWTVEAIRCEYQILREEIENMIRKHEQSLGAAAVEGALAVTARLIGQAERVSVRTLTRSSGREKSVRSGG